MGNDIMLYMYIRKYQFVFINIQVYFKIAHGVAGIGVVYINRVNVVSIRPKELYEPKRNRGQYI